ncbi:hypothetical protein AWB65_05450 [Caballeronia humi]|uniref:Uncharacterized protein n=1 Tax=Caballeronia humi TaxID=326474 RepID=A0A158IV00_9BURK|nr:hypothetical protein AWB65_05450 [Caballeronia humi]
MPEHHGALHANLSERLFDQRRLGLCRPEAIPRPFAVSKPRTIERNYAVMPRQPVNQPTTDKVLQQDGVSM